jgi:uncharacterized protein with PIN domain
MPPLSVMCLECKLRGEISHGVQQFGDPLGQCRHRLDPVECPALRSSLNAANRILNLMAWDQFMVNEESDIRVFDSSQTEEAIVLKPTIEVIEKPRRQERSVYPVNDSK